MAKRFVGSKMYRPLGKKAFAHIRQSFLAYKQLCAAMNACEENRSDVALIGSIDPNFERFRSMRVLAADKATTIDAFEALMLDDNTTVAKVVAFAC